MIADALRAELAQVMQQLRADATAIAAHPLMPPQVKGGVNNLIRALQLLEALQKGE